MRYLVSLLVLAFAAGLLAQELPDTNLTQVQHLKMQVHVLKVGLAQRDAEIAQLKAQLAQIELQQERNTLTGELLKDKSGMEIDWQTLTIKPTSQEKPPSK